MSIKHLNFEVVSISEYKQTSILGKITYLSLKRIDNSDNIRWSDLQEAKNIIFGNNYQALEVYPKQSDLIDYNNVRHLWILEEDIVLPFTIK